MMKKPAMLLMAALALSPSLADASLYSRIFGAPNLGDVLQTRLAVLDSGRALKVRGDKIMGSRDLIAFYRLRKGSPAWFANGHPTRVAWQLLDAVRKCPMEGLDPDEYHGPALDTLLRRFNRGGIWRMRGDPRAGADAELLLTDAGLLLARHLLFGRVRFKLPEDEWHVGRETIVVPEWLDRVLTDRRDLRNSLQELVPADPGYGRMKYWLGEYRRIQAAGGWPVVPEGPKLSDGANGPRVKALCLRLAADGGLPGKHCGEAWSKELGEALARFQASHGIEPNPAADAATLKQLNLPIDDRIDQIELNLECWRWLPRELGKRHVLVNIADFRLGVWEEDRETFSMRVVVGRKEDSTPVFSDSLVDVQLNPSWNVPAGIAKEEFLPELQKDPQYLAKHDMELLTDWSEKAAVVRADSIDWSSIDTAHFTFRVKQKNGDASALGRIKFVLNNPFNIYLHDTPSKGYFERHKRALSHGCVRLSEPMRLAEWTLRDNKDWDAGKLAAGIAEGEEKFIPIRPGIPVHILYWTCFTDPEGGLQFRPDVYGWNRRMEKALAKKAASF